MRGLELSDLEIFRVVATEGSVSGAAKKLHRVQSNISTRVRQLEERLGTILFHRQARLEGSLTSLALFGGVASVWIFQPSRLT